MTTTILRSLMHRGTVSASGYFFASGFLDEATIRHRVLKLWHESARIYRTDHGLVLLFAEPLTVDCRRALALPLVREGNLLTSFPLRKNDASRLAITSETIVLAVEGEVLTFSVDDLTIETPSDWLQIDGFAVDETTSLGEAVTTPTVVSEIETIDLREKLDGVPAADDELKSVLAAIRARKETAGQNAPGSSGAGVFDGWFSVGLSFGGLFRNLFRGLWGAAKGSGGRTGNGSGTSTTVANGPQPPGFLRKMFVRAAFFLKIGQLLGRRQARYLMKMMEMFEKGDLTDALKYAIPLSDMSDLQKLSDALPSLGILRPRSDLRIDLQRQEGNSSVFLENAWFNDLRALYRQTYERLVAQKRFEEAAFVLVELLNSHAEAVEFLEKHGKFRLAAELAEARKLPKETQARQWMLAGETEKAMRLAVLHDCFEYVVLRLESRHRPEAAMLRELWAQNLAAKGNFAAAVDTIWPLEERRSKALEWIDNAIEFGGQRAGAMLAKKIVLVPSGFVDHRSRVTELARGDDDYWAEMRAAFAREALRLPPGDELRVLVRPIVRKLIADEANKPSRLASPELKALVELSRDYALRTDLPRLTERKAPPQPEPLRLEISKRDAGSAKIYGAAYLSGERIALALGESGVKIVSKAGKTLSYFDQPTWRFIVADSGTSAICVAPRGPVTRLAKIDFVNRRAYYWCDARFTLCAPDFDGRIWFVVLQDDDLDVHDVFAIDTESADFSSLWKCRDIDGQIVSIDRTDSQLELLIRKTSEDEKWRYELPSMTLRAKETISRVVSDDDGNDSDVAVYRRGFEFEKLIPKLDFPEGTKLIVPEGVVDEVCAIKVMSDSWVLFRVYRTDGELLAEFFIEESFNAEIKLDAVNAIVTDRLGRVIIFDHRARVLRANLRL